MEVRDRMRLRREWRRDDRMDHEVDGEYLIMCMHNTNIKKLRLPFKSRGIF